MKIYHIKKRSHSNSNFPLTENQWQEANWVRIDSFLPESSAHRPETRVALLYDDQGIYGRFQVHDRFVRCLHTEFRSPVYQDACVEFFVQPADARSYFNFEFNACGTLLAGLVLNPERDETGKPKSVLPLQQSDLTGIKIRSSLQGPIKEEITDSVDWELEFFISFNMLSRYISDMKRPTGGMHWRCNFFKCAENNSHPHWASWAPVPELNFHLPEYFGELIFEG